MLNYKEITEEVIRKYAEPFIVQELDESIKSYVKWNMDTRKAIDGEYPTGDDYDDLVKSSHEQALGWLKRKYYTLYANPDTDERQQAWIYFNKLDTSYSLDQLAQEPVQEIELSPLI